MIINDSKNQIDRGGDVAESDFSIKATGKAFKILSDGLYSDKPKAIVRELSCNAFDAHVAAGRPEVPFELHLPTYPEPFFGVKDYGTGLSDFEVRGGWINEETNHIYSHEDGDQLRRETPDLLTGYRKVGGIFNTYFESTKANSNDYIGALGLGSKSPFSYVDSYTVISRHNGLKLSYNAFINEHDVPSIALLFTEETDEPNGLEITMPVRQSDFNTFISKASEVLRWFDPLPKINISHFNIETRPVLVTGKGWHLEKGNQSWGYHNRNGAIAVQGKIGYPLSSDAMGLSDVERVIVDSPFVMHFGIGELEISASRESLGYKPKTIASIKEKIKAILEELPLEFQKEISQCATLYDARVKLYNLMQSNYTIGNLISRGAFTLKYNGTTLKSSTFSINKKDFADTTVIYFGHRMTRTKVADHYYSTLDFNVTGSEEYFIDDLPRGGLSRLRVYGKTASHTVTLVKSEDQGQVDAFFALAGNPPVRRTSELPANKANRVIRTNVRVYAVSKYTEEFRDVVDDDEFDPEDGGLYVPLYRGKPSTGFTDGDAVLNNLKETVMYARTLGLIGINTRIYGITVRGQSILKEGEWVNAVDHIKQKLTGFIETNKLQDVAATRNCLVSFNSMYGWDARWTRALSLLPDLDNDHPIRRLNTLRDTKVGDAKTDTAVALANMLGVSLDAGVSSVEDLSALYETLKTKYPLIQHLNSIDKPEVKTAMIDYIKLIDSQNS